MITCNNTALEAPRLAACDGSGPSCVRMAARTKLFDEADTPDHLYEIVRGSVMIYKLLPDGRRQILEILREGDFAGLSGVESYGASATTLSPCHLRRYQRAQAALPGELQNRLARYLFGHQNALYGHALLLGRKSAVERIAGFLHAASAPRDGVEPDAEIHLTLAELSDYLQLRSETVCRQMTLLRKSGLIERASWGSYVVADREALKMLSEGFPLSAWNKQEDAPAAAA